MGKVRTVWGFSPSDEALLRPSAGSPCSTPTSPLTEDLRASSAPEKDFLARNVHRRSTSCVETKQPSSSRQPAKDGEVGIPIPHSRGSSASSISFFSLQAPGSLICADAIRFQPSRFQPDESEMEWQSTAEQSLNWDEDVFDMELPCPCLTTLPGLRIKTGRPKSKLNIIGR